MGQVGLGFRTLRNSKNADRFLKIISSRKLSLISSLVRGNGDGAGPGRPRVEGNGGRGRRSRTLSVGGSVGAADVAQRTEAEHEFCWRLELPLASINLKWENFKFCDPINSSGLCHCTKGLVTTVQT